MKNKIETAKHTPGPWQFYADVPSTDPNWHIVTNASRLRVVANVHIKPGNEMDQANARLIAAAPELLEALQSALGAIRYVTAFNIVPKLSDADLSRLACGEIGAQRSDEAKIGHVNTPFRDNAHGLKNSLSDIRGIIPALEAAIAKAERRAE